MPDEKGVRLENTRAENARAGTVMLVGERKLTLVSFLLKYNALIILLVLITISAIISPIFLSKVNLVNVLRQQTSYLIIAMGLLLCLLTGGIDLSVASTVGFGSIMITELVVNNNFGIIPAIFVTLVCAAIIGAINGTLVAYLGMAPFIVTLATSFGVMGVVYMFTRGNNTVLSPNTTAIEFFLSFGQNNDPLLGLPWKFYLTLALILITWFVLKYTSFGRLMTATGSNPVAVTLAGIDIKKYRLIGHVICSFSAGLAGIIITASNNSSAPTLTAGDYTMTAIAGTIIGGSDLAGGKGSVPFTVVGIFIMGLINNIMNLVNVPAYPQWIVKAIVIIFAIFLRSVVNTQSNK